LTAIAFVLLGEKPGAVQVLGIAVVCAGLVILAMASIRGHFDRRLMPPAFATGLTVAAYSALDAYGTRLDGNWLAYTCWLIAVDATSFALLITWMKGPRFWRELPRDSIRIVVSGAFGLLSFLVLLWALSRSPVGAVSARCDHHRDGDPRRTTVVPQNLSSRPDCRRPYPHRGGSPITGVQTMAVSLRND
jgi:drug/metabolite transporter (DMT)-like permease